MNEKYPLKFILMESVLDDMKKMRLSEAQQFWWIRN